MKQLMTSSFPEVQSLRASSRELVRELGFLQSGLADAGMPHSHVHALIELERRPLNQRELAARLRLDTSTTSRIVASLAKHGWIRTEPRDGRTREVSLTATGRTKLRGIHQMANSQVGHALSLLAPTERAQVVTGLELYARAERKKDGRGFG
jgi:DNA-binding MarR family transcriptional regulator